MTPTAPIDRLHGLDALRGFALLLGIALHTSMSYLPGAETFWIVAESQPSVALGGFFFWVHSFRMSLFFLLAGYFGRLLLERRGLGGLLRDRVRRILLPLLAFWFPLLVAAIWAAWLKHGGTPPEQEQPPLSAENFPLMHLWFLYLLCLFYPALLMLRALLAWIDRGGRVQAALDAGMRAALGPRAALILALPVAGALAMHEGWWQWFGIPTPDQSLYPSAAALLCYGLAFLVGWAMQRQPALLQALARRWPLNLALALIGHVACIALIGWQSPAAPAEHGAPQTWLYAYAYGLCGWGWTLALLGLALRYLQRAHPASRYLAESSYFLYLAHLPVVMAAQVLASRVQAPWWVEYPVALALSLTVLLALYQLGVRHTALGRWLNGGSPRRAQAPVVASGTSP
ncbi:MAG: acyltransferase family protein [Aquimonas sp.]